MQLARLHMRFIVGIIVILALNGDIMVQKGIFWIIG